uniref:Cytochrome p450 CYP3045C14 n=1 Tax=Brachionus calyciflorus TaxID=104777 RepID=A0A2H4PSH4_9BILA|nr:cytochrome p450 CYP3045C14 [Brachionus calyciflorus]
METTLKIFKNVFNEEEITNILSSSIKSIGPLFIIKICTISVTSLVAIYLGKIWYSYCFFKKRSIPGPEPEFLFGNYRQILQNKNYSETIRDWTQKYGRTYGYFEGHQPVLITSDLEIIQQVFIKQAANFNARKRPVMDKKEDDPSAHLFQSSKARWKRMRTIMNPTFSSAKLRELGPLLVNCTDRLVDCLGSVDNKEIEISPYFKRFTMDSIWNCAFGIDLNMQYEKENEYFNKCEAVFRGSGGIGWPIYLGIFFHEYRQQILQGLILANRIMSKFIDPKKLTPFFWLRLKVKELVEIRKKETSIKKKDYIQILLDAKADFEEEKNFNYTEMNKKLTGIEIEANLVLFMLAGYETTSTTLSYASYILANHQDEQIKLYDEIIAHFGSDLNEINSENVLNLQYLDLSFKSLPNSKFDSCSKVYFANNHIKNIKIPLDLPIAIDVMVIHFDSELWGPVDPNIFYPKRHEIKRNPLAFLTFGIGPRNCIGMKFALKELKIALVNLILNFEFYPGDKGDIKDLKISESPIRQPVNGVKVFLKKRNLF